jgi:hypothetical protein
MLGEEMAELRNIRDAFSVITRLARTKKHGHNNRKLLVAAPFVLRQKTKR